MYVCLAKDMNNAHDILLVHVVYSALDRDLNDLLPMGTTSASLIPLGVRSSEYKELKWIAGEYYWMVEYVCVFDC